MKNNQFKDWCEQGMFMHSLPLIMAIINVTPDSFSDGGCFLNVDKALSHARKLIAEGADILDIGGESSRPGAKPVCVNEELDRVIPLIEKLRQETSIAISIDTTKPDVMQEAIRAGANIINDISALSAPNALNVAARLNVFICLMHMQGNPTTMQISPHYPLGVINEVNHFFDYQITRCLDAGIDKEKLILDPGFAFGKTVRHNMQLVSNLNAFKRHNLPILLGVSRKSTLGYLLNKPVNERLIGSITLSIIAIQNGTNIIRTHDVKETKDALIIMQAIDVADKEEIRL